MGRILAVANQKGGVAKTTTVVSLGAALAEHQLRVLMVDLDAQACLTFSTVSRAIRRRSIALRPTTIGLTLNRRANDSIS